jgi:hypothetical protein
MSDAVLLNTSAVVYLTDGKSIKLMTKISVRVFTLFGDLSVSVLVLILNSGSYQRRKIRSQNLLYLLLLHLEQFSQTTESSFEKYILLATPCSARIALRRDFVVFD